MDAPCTGSGSWRRDPAGKWALTAGKLAELLTVQAGILDQCRAWLRPGGVLAYATCSLLTAENEAQVEGFLGRHLGWGLLRAHRFSPLQGGDGFFVALLTQAPGNNPQL
jgi:16S rRNA (cytosine967-C5)-methyltransferase